MVYSLLIVEILQTYLVNKDFCAIAVYTEFDYTLLKDKVQRRGNIHGWKAVSQDKYWQNLKTSSPPHHNSDDNYKDRFFNQGRSARNTKIYKVNGKSLSLLIKKKTNLV